MNIYVSPTLANLMVSYSVGELKGTGFHLREAN